MVGDLVADAVQWLKRVEERKRVRPGFLDNQQLWEVELPDWLEERGVTERRVETPRSDNRGRFPYDG